MVNKSPRYFLSLEFAKLKSGEVVKIMSKSENLVIVRQLYEVMEKGDYSLLSPLLTEDIRRHGLTLEQRLEVEFLENKWVHVTYHSSRKDCRVSELP